mgnify:CR=1 FL=1
MLKPVRAVWVERQRWFGLLAAVVVSVAFVTATLALGGLTRSTLDGALDGDIVTRLKIEGVKQGQLAKKNFITRRLAGLPIQFNVNIKAPFQRLVTSFKGMYDDSYVRDPRSLGLVGSQGEQLDASGKPLPQPAPKNEKTPAIQPPVSRNRPR